MLDLTQTAEPAKLPISIDDAMEHCRVIDNTEAGLLREYIEAATHMCEQWTGRKFITQTWVERFDAFPAGTICLALYPIQSISAVRYTDPDGASQTVSASDYTHRAGRLPNQLTLNTGKHWPTGTDVEVEYIVGAAEAPAAARQAIRLLVGHWYENRESVLVGTISSELPHAVTSLLQSVRVRGV